MSINYANGVHGIAGLGSMSGSDKVYSLENGNAMQCFCADNGTGVQTNWLKASNLSSDEIKVYLNDNWIYIPNGADWGLSEGVYLAKNIDYSCNSSTSNGGSGSSSSNGSSTVQAATGTNLASTGNMPFVLSVFGTGVVMFATGLTLRKLN